jgi:hypothetical protein
MTPTRNISLLDNIALPSKHSVLAQRSRIHLQLNSFCEQVDNHRYSDIRKREGKGDRFGTFRVKETTEKKTRTAGVMFRAQGGSKFATVLTGV